jgi:hypothetical protein
VTAVATLLTFKVIDKIYNTKIKCKQWPVWLRNLKLKGKGETIIGQRGVW